MPCNRCCLVSLAGSCAAAGCSCRKLRIPAVRSFAAAAISRGGAGLTREAAASRTASRPGSSAFSRATTRSSIGARWSLSHSAWTVWAYGSCVRDDFRNWPRWASGPRPRPPLSNEQPEFPNTSAYSGVDPQEQRPRQGTKRQPTGRRPSEHHSGICRCAYPDPSATLLSRRRSGIAAMRTTTPLPNR